MRRVSSSSPFSSSSSSSALLKGWVHALNVLSHIESLCFLCNAFKEDFLEILPLFFYGFPMTALICHEIFGIGTDPLEVAALDRALHDLGNQFQKQVGWGT